MRAIYKYELQRKTEQVIMLPVGAKILHAEFQGNVLCVWAIIDPIVTTLAPHTFYITLTGSPFPDPIAEFSDYVGTTTDRDGFVAHVFVQI